MLDALNINWKSKNTTAIVPSEDSLEYANNREKTKQAISYAKEQKVSKQGSVSQVPWSGRRSLPEVLALRTHPEMRNLHVEEHGGEVSTKVTKNTQYYYLFYAQWDLPVKLIQYKRFL